MVEKTPENKMYWDKVNQISCKVGCSHHPQAALDLIQQNDWGVAKEEITPDSFDGDYSFGIISGSSLDKLSPRQRVAYETVRKWFMQAPALAYFGGRVIRNGFSMPDKDVSLDNIVFESASDHCGSIAARKAYSIEFPLSATLDQVVGGVVGLAVAPIGFVAGLLYTPRKNQEQTEGYAVTK